MASIMEYLENTFTNSGAKALHTRLKSLAKLYEERINYPYTGMMFGFPKLHIRSKEHHEGMMDELSQILGIKMEE